MLRFAQSPTGDMTIDDLRIALLTYLAAKERGERFVVRIVDGDRRRNIEAKEREILEIMALFGIPHDDTTYRSRNLTIHQHMAVKLLQTRKAFACFCSPETLEAQRKKAEEAGIPYRYDGCCENLTDAEVIDNPNPFTIRLKKPDASVTVEDLLHGIHRFDPETIDRFVIMDVEKYPTEDFACAVDDMLQDISLVFRGEEALMSSARQVAVRDALGYDKKVRYAHLPPLCIAGGALPTVRSLLEEGYLPEAIVNWLLLPILGEHGQEVFTLDEAQRRFRFEKLSQASVTLEIETLRTLNREHIRRTDPKELSRAFGFADADIGELAKAFLEEGSTIAEIRPRIAAIFAPKSFEGSSNETMEALRSVLRRAPHFETYEAFFAYVSERTGLANDALEQPLRLLLTGRETGPDLASLYPHLKNYLQEIVK